MDLNPKLVIIGRLDHRLTRWKLVMLAWLSRRSKWAFISQLLPNGRLLDVGCGNNSPYRTKLLRGDINYVGVDVADCNQTAPILADEYVICNSSDFCSVIGSRRGTFNAVISSHNLEHCEDPEGVVRALSGALCPEGKLYLSFPCESSTAFPRRAGTLNFFDDPTHRKVPKFARVREILEQSGCNIIVSERRYRPFVLLVIGLLVEPISRLTHRKLPGTWALYGFESVMWAVKRPHP